MGKGDLKSFRGKLFNHSYGVYRTRGNGRSRRSILNRGSAGKKNNTTPMEEIKINGLTVYMRTKAPEKKYRSELSNLLIKTFGHKSYSDHESARKALTFSYDYFCDKFHNLCNHENSLLFYQFILSQHEQTTEIAHFSEYADFPDGCDMNYISIYRRVLKWILEQACDISLHTSEKPDDKFVTRAKSLLDELLYLGDTLFTCASVYAEQDMIEDVAEIIFDSNKKFAIQHKHHYDEIINLIQDSYAGVSVKTVADEDGINDLKRALDDCFGLKYDNLSSLIAEIHNTNKDKGGQYCGFGWESLPLSAESVFKLPVDQARVFYRGLTLDKTNKLDLQELVIRPHTMFRYMYRPILIWNINGEDFAYIGKNGFTESIIQLATNCIPWGKAPLEWVSNKCFLDYVNSKRDSHDKWLDDLVEKKLKDESIKYFRNITSIDSEEGSLSLIVPNVGEIDFLIIEHETKTIYVADCKHLQGRYDMISQKSDYTHFIKPNGYNDKIKNKVDFISSHLAEVNYHNKTKYGTEEPDISEYKTEGIFIINQPTFYMYNSDYRIYMVKDIIDVIKRRKVDEVFNIMIEDDDSVKMQNISYPYFRKPSYLMVDLSDDEE